jgi:hypothetical protein
LWAKNTRAKTMSAMSEFYTITGASEALRRDRRSVRVALRDVPPDGEPDTRDRPRWRLGTITRALAAYDRHAPGTGRNARADTVVERLCSDMETVAVRIERELRRLGEERDAARKAELAPVVGALIGELDGLFIDSLAELLPAERDFARIALDAIMRRLIGDFIIAAGYSGIALGTDQAPSAV